MENKEKLDQNPKAAEKPSQEENSAVSNETKQVIEDQTNVKAEKAQDDIPEVAAVETPITETASTEIVEETVKVEEAIVETPVVEAISDEIVEETVKVEETIVETLSSEEILPVVTIEEPVEQVIQEVEVEAAPEKSSDAVKAEEVSVASSEETISDDASSDDEDEDDEDEDEIVSEESYSTHSLEELVSELETIVESDKIVKSKSKVSFIRLNFGKKINEIKQKAEEKFIEDGGLKEEYKPEPIAIEEQFNRAFGKYKSLRRKHREVQEKEKVENLSKKNALLEEMRELISSDERLKDTYDKFNEIQNLWRETGMVPQADAQLLWNNYHFLVEKFFDKVKINKELRDLDLKKNLEAKIALCEKAEELLIEDSVNKSFKLLQEYHNEWKAIGPVPSSNNDEIWERFKTASDKLNDRRKAHYDELQDKLEENYQAKLALCAKAEELILKPVDSIKEWGKLTDEMDELLKVWKTLGPAPRKVNDEVWASFKGYLNNFFENKKKYFNKIKEEQQENYQRKLDLLKQSQSLKDSTDWNASTKTLIHLQKEWKKIGPVPRKYSEDIWKQFRAANDFFFESKAKHFKGQFAEEDENLTKKQALIQEIKTAQYSANKKENLEMIKIFQRRWTEIGNVPKKEMDKLYKDYRSAVDEQLDKLDISKVDFKNSGFRDRISDLKSNDDNSNLKKERFSIQKSLDTLKEDVMLWENNMGFFRNSKNADVLKLEFEKKIQKAKAEILILKEKLKMIDK